MTIDLQSMKRLAELLAVDVLDQIEKDGGVNRVNLAEKLLAGLLLEAANAGETAKAECEAIAQTAFEPRILADHITIDDVKPQVSGWDRDRHFMARGSVVKVIPAGGGGGGGGGASGGGGGGGYLVNLDAAGARAVHLVCLCDECKRRRKLSLCGCEMCMHHTEAAAYIASVPQQQAELRKEMLAEQRAHKLAIPRREQHNPQLGDVMAWRQSGLIIWRPIGAHIVELNEIDLHRMFHELRTLIGYAGPHIDRCVPLQNQDLVLMRTGELLTGLEAAQRGVK